LKPTLDPIYLESRRQALIRRIRLVARVGSGRPALLKVRRAQRALNLINKRLKT
jgi:hypothetical protein